MYRDIYHNIASYLTHFDIIKSLECIEHESHLLVDEKNRNIAKMVLKYKDPINRFHFSCQIGYIDGVIYYYSDENIIEGYKLCCMNGHISIAKLLYSMNSIELHNNHSDIFIVSCIYGHLDIAQWLYKLQDTKIDDTLFFNVCDYGKLNVAQWLYSINGINDVGVISDNFHRICKDSNLDVIQWLYSLNILTINDSTILCNSVSKSNIKLAQWIYSLGKVDEIINEAFTISCLNNNMDISQWLYSTGLVYRYTNAFTLSCARGYLDMAKWLYGLGNIDIGIHNNEVFKYSSGDVLEWLHDIAGFRN